MGDVIKVDYVEAKAQVLRLLELAYNSDQGLKVAGGILKEKTELKVTGWGVGEIKCKGVTSNFNLHLSQLDEFGAVFHVLSGDMLGIEIEIYPDREGGISIEGEISRHAGEAVSIAAGAKITFDIVELIKKIPGIARAINDYSFDKDVKKYDSYMDCILIANHTDPQCKRANGLH
jgi:hypothetical protein